MKQLFFLLLALNFYSCSSYSQKESGKVVIDSTLKNILFNNPIISAQEGSYKVFIDSILIDSNDSKQVGETFINADIKDLNQKHYHFDTCSSYFIGDTLIIYFKNTLKVFNDRIIIKIIKDDFFPFFINENMTKEHKATSSTFKLNKEIVKKSEVIFGELAIKFFDPETQIEYFFKGPFTCNINPFFLPSRVSNNNPPDKR